MDTILYTEEEEVGIVCDLSLHLFTVQQAQCVSNQVQPCTSRKCKMADFEGYSLIKILVIGRFRQGCCNVNSLDFCPALLKSLVCFYFRCIRSSQWKEVTVNFTLPTLKAFLEAHSQNVAGNKQ